MTIHHPDGRRVFVGAFLPEQPAAIPSCVPTLEGPDPFGLAHDCLNPAGHDSIASCGEIVCRHCAKVFWR